MEALGNNYFLLDEQMANAWIDFLKEYRKKHGTSTMTLDENAAMVKKAAVEYRAKKGESKPKTKKSKTKKAAARKPKTARRR